MDRWYQVSFNGLAFTIPDDVSVTLMFGAQAYMSVVRFTNPRVALSQLTTV